MVEDGKDFLATPEPAQLGPDSRAGVKSEADLNAELDEWLRTKGLARDRQQLIRALVLLWHDHLDAAHRLAQEVDNADGAFVHGMMHRREPDASNAAYWFRRVGKHPAFPELAKRVKALLSARGDEDLLRRLVSKGEWDPFAFIEACSESGSDAGKAAKLRQVQQIETEVLLGLFASKE
jgi:hypothetical protein